MPTEQKHYYAFVSHSSRDAKIALWLRDKLVNYNIPASIRKENQMPKRLRPVFIYQTDLAGANLQDALQRELEDSQWLIVVCSPDGAKSQYVNGEVEHFINTGRANKIIPFIVGGTPHAKNAEDECFPPALLKLAEEGIELRGVNLAECQKQLGSKMGAVVNVVATMLGVRFDSMWNVYQRKQRRQLFFAATIAALFCLAGLFTWDYLRPTYKYFADYVDKWGVPEGVVELTKEQKSHRNRMYRFEYRRIPFGEPNAWQWRVVKVSYVNSADMPEYNNSSQHVSNSAIIETRYNKQDGHPDQWIFIGDNGKILLRHSLSDRNGNKACIADFISAKERQGVGFANQIKLYSNSSKSNIVRYVYERDANGYIIKQTFHSNNDYNIRRSIAKNEDGIYGYAYNLDSLHRSTQISFLDKNGQWISNKQGVAGQIFKYDEYGNICYEAYIDINGHPTWGKSHCVPITIYISDTNGNVSSVTNNNPQGVPCYDRYSGGSSKVVYTYNEKGYKITNEFFSIDGSPYTSKYSGHKCIYTYNEKGQAIERACYDTDGQPFLTPNGAKEKHKFDRYGNIIERAHYGTDGHLFAKYDGVAIERSQYDDEGNQLEEAFYDVHDRLYTSSAGYAKWKAVYDEYGNKTEWSFYGEDGQPCMRGIDNVAKWCYRYDERGNEIERWFCDTEGKPCIHSILNCASFRKEYDDSGNLTEISYYGIAGEPSYAKGGYHKEVSEYDGHGNCISRTYYGIDGKLCLNEESIAKRLASYDGNGNRIEETFYGIDGKPCMHKEGYSKYTAKFDERGHLTEAVFYDTKGNICKNAEGIAKFTDKYDDHGNQIENAFYGTDGKLTITDFGGAIRRKKYNEFGDVIEESYFDTEDKPCLCARGYSIVRYSYDLNENVTEKAYFDTDGKPCLFIDANIGIGYARYTCEYDERGNLSKKTYYDKDGREVQVGEK